MAWFKDVMTRVHQRLCAGCSGAKKAEGTREHALKTFLSRPIEEVMVPRGDVVAFPRRAEFREVMEALHKFHLLAIPVYHDALDHVVGVLTVHTALSLVTAGKEEAWSRHLLPPSFAPASMKTEEAIRKVADLRIPLIFVVDEYGGVEGIFERKQIFRKFAKEFCASQASDLQGLSSGMVISADPLILNGRIDIEEFEKMFFLLPISQGDRERVNTLGGWLCSLSGHVPQKGETIKHPEGIEFEVLKANSRCVLEVAILREGGRSSTTK